MKVKALEIQHRRDRIIALLEQFKVLRVTQLVNELGVSDETIRKDLRILEKQGLIIKNYGTASLVASTTDNIPKKVTARMGHKQTAKYQLAQKVLEILPVDQNKTIALDQGTTIATVAEVLSEYTHNTIFSSSLLALSKLATTNNTVYCLGGRYDRNDMSYQFTDLGLDYEAMHYDYCLMGSSGVKQRHGICSTSFADAQMKRHMVTHSEVSIAVIEAEKFEATSLVEAVSWQEIDYVVTNIAPDAPMVAELQAQTHLLLV